ncbi:MAG: hypothetical protein KDB53_18180 [Planctomycetes bacterium]|nr:hypothetical protein [Planctomycetota bacterium]
MNARYRQIAYDRVLARGAAGYEAFYEALRARHLKPTPAEDPDTLYAPNPVLVPAAIVQAMTEDLRRFFDHRRGRVRDAQDLLALMPSDLSHILASTEVAAKILSSLDARLPFSVIDAYLVEGPQGLDRSYLEWQSFPAYPGLAIQVLEATMEVFPELAEVGARPHPDPKVGFEQLRERMRGALLPGLDDARECVIIDIDPDRQATRWEFRACQTLTGGPERGCGIIDPREVRYEDGRPVYQRNGLAVPIRTAMSRLVYDDVMQNLVPRLSPDARENLSRFFRDATNVDWLVHPLHFHYGNKGNFPDFHAAGLSDGLVPCLRVDPELRQRFRDEGRLRLDGWVQKPIEGCAGRAVTPNPALDDLEDGSILQRMIKPASCHRTLAGDREPEVRVMAVPDGRGGLDCGGLFTRVKAPREFCSNAGITARAAVAGTGEGYGLVI